MEIRRIEKIHKTVEIQLELDWATLVICVHPDHTVKLISPQSLQVKEQSTTNSVEIELERRK